MAGLFGTLFGGGGGVGGGVGSMQDFLDFQREQQARLKLEGEEAEEFAKTLTSFRRGVLADRPGFGGLVNVGSAVQASDARLAARIATLDPDDPEAIAFRESQAAERTDRAKSLMTISGEEFKIRGRIRSLSSGLKNADLDKLRKIIKGLTDLEGERSGRFAGREDVGKNITKAEERIQLLKLREKARQSALGFHGDRGQN